MKPTKQISMFISKQEVSRYMAKHGSTPELEAEWEQARDARSVCSWDDQVCICGKKGWCGRDSHRPDYAVNPETNGTIFFNAQGEPKHE